MVTKKYVKRLINLFNHLRGPDSKSSLENTTYILTFAEKINEANVGGDIYSQFYSEVMRPYKYRTPEIMEAATKFLNTNIKTID